MRHFSTFLSIVVLGLAVEMGTSCSKQTLPPTTSNTSVQDYKVAAPQDSTSQPSTGHTCGGSHNGQG